uniref:RRM domain-containing protein n=1 Tax=Caenorhabditis japonica TaxID=281687 RepID=A0A8R1I1L9_CAEJA
MVAPSPKSISQGGRKPKVVAKKSPKKPAKKLFVVKLQRIPFGFFEKELLGYFRQFGNVLRIRVARSRKTGNHKGWAYVGFDDKSVAEIAAESMNGYLMFEQRLGCKVMKPALIPKSMLKGPLLVVRPSYKGLAKKDAISRNNTSGKNDKANAKNRVISLNKSLKKLKNMGVDYDFSLRTPLKNIAPNNDVQVVKTPISAKPVQSKPVTPAPKPATPTAKPATPKAIVQTPVTTKKKAVETPQTAKLKNEESKPKFSPKTRAAKAIAAGTPLVKSTLSKTIMKSVAASACPANVKKAPLPANKRGKKKSL